MITSEQVAGFPNSPGVYIMKDNAGNILYVGKARNLRQRIRAYVGAPRDGRPHIRFLMNRVIDVGYIVTDTEKEALILENTLIKKHRPKYNIDLRDDKTYFSLRLDMNEEFPRLTVIRKVPRDNAGYFGPYASASAAREVLKQLYKLFPLRHHNLESCRRRGRPCLFYELRQCSGPCHGLISASEYAALAEGAALFLAGKNRDLLATLKQRMTDAAGKENYEEAARCRNLINAITVTLEKQKMVHQGGESDVIGIHREGNQWTVAILFMRGGSITGNRSYSFRWELDDAEGLASFIFQYYNSGVFIPAELLLPIPLDDAGVIAEILAELRGRQVVITSPQRGIKVELVRLAAKNAATSANEKARLAADSLTILKELQERLHLPCLPQRIECYDISNLQGRHAVGSRVSFHKGEPDKAGYRRYRIKGVTGADDFAMLHEVLSRRFRPDKGRNPHPDLIIVDGGIGQLNILTRCLAELGITDVSAASLAKSRVMRSMAETDIARSDERVFLPGRKNPVVLRQNSPPLLLLARIRDEAHRFAITYHKKLRGKAALTSGLSNIRGIGPSRQRELLRHFGSLAKIRKATIDELKVVKGITPPLAASILAALADTKKAAPE